jgi:trimethylamine--corrinoid protein Co-methyltransferase
MSGRRGGGRAGRASRRRDAAANAFDHAWRHWVNPYPPIEQFSIDQIEAIHKASLRVLVETGIRVLNDEAKDLYRQAGMCVDDEGRVRFDPDLLMALIAKAPSEVTMRARATDRNVTMGGRHVGVCTTGGTPNVSDLDGGRRPGTLNALEDFCRLAQSFESFT